MRGLVWLSVLFAVGCSADADKDGVRANKDCNDEEASAYPGADELCNGIDDDCDGVVDDAPADGGLWFVDVDGDGFGDVRTAGVLACEAPVGTVDNDLDCDDEDAEANPDALDVCNGSDDNCDGQIDEIDAITWYLDADADGYGVTEKTKEDCAQPPGYVADDGDCNDGNAAYNPGASDDVDCADPKDFDCSGKVDFPDADDDGANLCDDCDDADAKRFPGNVEVCDGIDQDCDTKIDDDPSDGSVFHADADGDTFGDNAAPLNACAQPAGFVVDATDCDDTLSGVRPGAVELCNGVDDDCDTIIDDGTVDAIPFYPDADADGFGDLAGMITACALPSGYSTLSTDCDDVEAAVYPGATEVCEDGLDNDCDTVGEPTCEIDGGLDIAGYGAFWAGEADDQASYSLSYVGDFDGDGFDDFVVGAPMTTVLGAGAAYLVFGDSDPTGDYELATDGVALSGVNSSDVLGVSVAGGDFDGDGNADVAAGAPQLGSGEGGGVYIVYGASTRPTSGSIGARAGTVFTSTQSFDYAGYGTDQGDSDGDGLADLIIGAPFSSRGGAFSGAAYLVLGDAAWGAAEDLADAQAIFTSDTTFSLLGDITALGIVEVDGDGNGEVLLGSTDGSTTAYLSLFDGGSVSGSYNVVDDADALLTVSTTIQGRVYLNNVGDLDDDGTNDLAVGWDFYGSDGESLVTLFYGDTTGFSGTIAADTVADATFLSARDDGTAIASGGDVDGDGVSDLVIGGSAKTAGAGQVYVFYGGSLSGDYAYGDADDAIAGETGNEFFGGTLGAEGDIDGDGFADVIAGAVGHSDSGAVYVFLGTSL